MSLSETQNFIFLNKKEILQLNVNLFILKNILRELNSNWLFFF